MTATKNDKVDAKPAMQFVHPNIWNTIQESEKCNVTDFEIQLMDMINGLSSELFLLEDILKLISWKYGRANVLRWCGLAMRAGEIKYGNWNFLSGHGRWQLIAAMERHALCVLDGEMEDPDTSALLNVGVPHIGCIVAGINMIWWQEKYGTSVNDGPPSIAETETVSPIIEVGDLVEILENNSGMNTEFYPIGLHVRVTYIYENGRVEISNLLYDSKQITKLNDVKLIEKGAHRGLRLESTTEETGTTGTCAR